MTSDFVIYPAIDLHEGRVVRLSRGDIQHETHYADDPGRVADEFISLGADWLHVIDLDGAIKGGQSPNANALDQILSRGVRLQYGGGLRDLEQISWALERGVSRVLIGTLAVEAPERVEKALNQWGPERIAVALDAREGSLVSKGWTENTGLDPTFVGLKLRRMGLETTLVTDVQRDGMGSGINLEYARRIVEKCGLRVIAAGGARTLDDVREARNAGLAGIVIGRALYEGQIELKEALRC